MKDTDTDTMEMTNDQQPATKDYLADLIRRFENRMIERWNDMDRKMMRWKAGPEDLPTIEDRATNDAEKQERDEEGDGDEIGEALTTSPIKDAAIKVQGEAGRKLKVDKADKTTITAIDMKPPIKDAKEIQNTVSTDDTEENGDKVMETFNFFDPVVEIGLKRTKCKELQSNFIVPTVLL